MIDAKQVMTNLSDLSPAPWRANYVLKPDMNLLSVSMKRYGWLYPIIVMSGTNQIIDGHHRFAIATENDSLAVGGKIPCVFADVDEIDAMVMHVQLNRSKGQLMAKSVSEIVRSVLFSKKYDDATLRSLFQMGKSEFDLMIDGSLIKQRNIKDHVYSRAWIPIESSVDEKPSFERPPTPDR